MSDRPYRVAELAYRPWDKDYPWYVVRVGAVIDQGGGFRFGTEGLGFKSLENAITYIESATMRDLEAIEDTIKAASKWTDANDYQDDWP